MMKKLHRKVILPACFAASMFTANAQNALEFDGSNDYITTTAPSIEGNASRTVEAWINASYDSGQRFIVGMGTMDAGTRFSFKINPGSSYIRVEIGGGGLTGSDYITNSQWHHVAVVYDNSLTSNKYKLYVDGVLDTQGNIGSNDLAIGSNNMAIGARNDLDPATYFDGKIAEVRVWNVARTATEIANNKDVTLCGNEDGLVAYYQFNEGTAGTDNSDITTVSDLKNGYNGTLHNFSLSGGSSNYVAGPTLTSSVDDTVTLDASTLMATETGATYQWFNCADGNVAVDGATGQSFTPEVSGTYAVEITDSEGCMVTSTCMAVEVESLGVEDTLFANSLKVYPNPASGNVNVTLNSVYETVDAQLVSITGKVVAQYQFSNTNEFSLDLNKFNSGLYFLNLKADHLDAATVKVVKM
ncbi:LamG-like jellyroll fold domain-containing protein [Mangrovimonas sp. YM274]|uniref:LamG-like jellyroll fold domain-containing protein n=1 Tax=Mangrovimonas sp. YM274 TaxID=3070660 RepID=UPI0027DDA975|nr:LamG-like jellyroll fold domain-containing protein [Mangrovimonas sp. YM274]WMI70222.1 LamG-like jellyroll fold domain-containing protein [Mangrovimonas sp. YM274]